jgi:hypothetical protein
MSNPNGQATFKQMSAADFAVLDSATKNTMVQERHKKILEEACREIKDEKTGIMKPGALIEQFTTALQTIGPSGKPFEPKDLVAVLMHRDDPITPPDLRAQWAAKNLEVAVLVAQRREFAQGIAEFGMAPDERIKPYANAARVLSDEPPEGFFYSAVFDMGMCTVTANVMVTAPEKTVSAPSTSTP